MDIILADVVPFFSFMKRFLSVIFLVFSSYFSNTTKKLESNEKKAVKIMRGNNVN